MLEPEALVTHYRPNSNLALDQIILRNDFMGRLLVGSQSLGFQL